MKIIDVLNKIANDEEVPQKIIYSYCEYTFDKDINDYININGNMLFKYLFAYETEALNKEIEIIEEDKEIEELGSFCISTDYKKEALFDIANVLDKIYGKVDELVREVNRLKKEGK